MLERVPVGSTAGSTSTRAPDLTQRGPKDLIPRYGGLEVAFESPREDSLGFGLVIQTFGNHPSLGRVVESRGLGERGRTVQEPLEIDEPGA